MCEGGSLDSFMEHKCKLSPASSGKGRHLYKP